MYISNILKMDQLIAESPPKLRKAFSGNSPTKFETQSEGSSHQNKFSMISDQLQPKNQPDDFEKFTIASDDDEDVFKRALTGSFLPAIALVCQERDLVSQVIEAEHGFTLLHAASYHSNVKAVKTLLYLGADPNQQDYR